MGREEAKERITVKKKRIKANKDVQVEGKGGAQEEEMDREAKTGRKDMVMPERIWNKEDVKEK